MSEASYNKFMEDANAIFTQEDLDAFLFMITDTEGFVKQAKDTGVPGLDSHVRAIMQAGNGAGMNVSFPWLEALNAISEAKYDPAAYAEKRMYLLSDRYTKGTLPGYGDDYIKIYGGYAENDLQEIKDLAKYLIQNK